MRVTVKLGGSILEDASIRSRILGQVSAAAALGHEIILVHGGGKSLNRRLAEMQRSSRFVEGLRVTDGPTLEVAVMVLAGGVNKRIVSELSGLGSGAVGICGADAGAVRCTPASDLPGYPESIGFVGKPVTVNRAFFDLLLKSGLLPVVASIALGPDSGLYNVNADQMASACAWGTQCAALVYLTDVAGVREENGAVIPSLSPGDIADLRTRGILSGGMLPKTASCLEAVAAGVGSVCIVPGAAADVLTRFLDGTLTEGTTIHGATET